MTDDFSDILYWRRLKIVRKRKKEYDCNREKARQIISLFKKMPTLEEIAQKIDALDARISALEKRKLRGIFFPKTTTIGFLISFLSFSMFWIGEIEIDFLEDFLGIDYFTLLIFGIIGMLVFGIAFGIQLIICLFIRKENSVQKHDLKTEEKKSEKLEVFETSPSEKVFSAEEFFGKSLFTKIGVILSALGVGFFVKYSFENGWIGALGRVSLGMLAGIAFVALGDYLSAKYKKYALTIMGGGFAMMYFSIFAARNFYTEEIGLDPGTAFAILILITIAAVFLAHRHDEEIFAIFALGGGFATPFLVNGGDNLVGLLSYILLLDMATLFLAAHHKWTKLSLGAFIATFLLSAGTFLEVKPAITGALFLAAFFLVFVGFSLANIFGKKEHFSQIVFSFSLLAPLFYFGEMMVFFEKYDLEGYRGFLSLGLAALYVLIGSLSFQRKSDQRIIESFFGAALSFIAVAVYFQANEFWTLLVWAFEGGVLFWLGQKNKWEIWKLGAILLGIATIWYFAETFFYQSQKLLINDRVIIGATLVAIFWYLQWKFEENPIVPLFRIAIFLMPILIGWAEISDFFSRQFLNYGSFGYGIGYPNRPPSDIINNMRNSNYNTQMKIGLGHSIFLALYGVLFFFIGSIRNIPIYRLAAIGVFLLAILKVLVVDLWELGDLYRIFSVLSLGAILLGVGFLYHRNQKFFFPEK